MSRAEYEAGKREQNALDAMFIALTDAGRFLRGINAPTELLAKIDRALHLQDTAWSETLSQPHD